MVNMQAAAPHPGSKGGGEGRRKEGVRGRKNGKREAGELSVVVSQAPWQHARRVTAAARSDRDENDESSSSSPPPPPVPHL